MVTVMTSDPSRKLTTPDSPRNTWPQRQFRLDDQTFQATRVKIAVDNEKYQRVVETLLHGWLSGVIDLDVVRNGLAAKQAAKQGD